MILELNRQQRLIFLNSQIWRDVLKKNLGLHPYRPPSPTRSLVFSTWAMGIVRDMPSKGTEKPINQRSVSVCDADLQPVTGNLAPTCSIRLVIAYHDGAFSIEQTSNIGQSCYIKQWNRRTHYLIPFFSASPRRADARRTSTTRHPRSISLMWGF